MKLEFKACKIRIMAFIEKEKWILLVMSFLFLERLIAMDMYQGEGYPDDASLDYKTNVEAVAKKKALTFAFERYSQTLLPIRFMVFGIGLFLLYEIVARVLRPFKTVHNSDIRIRKT